MALSATQTVSTFNQTLRLNNNGAPNYIWGHFDTTTKTLSDIVFLCRIPTGATIVDWGLRGATGETAAVAKLGITANGTETTFGTLTFSTGAVVTHRPFVGGSTTTWTPFRVSISDTDAANGATVYMTVSTGTWTTSASFDFFFVYYRDGLVT